MIFFKGASLPDPRGLFNAELGGNTRRAIKFFEGDKINEPALRNLVRAGVDLNGANSKGKRPTERQRVRAKSRSR